MPVSSRMLLTRSRILRKRCLWHLTRRAPLRGPTGVVDVVALMEFGDASFELQRPNNFGLAVGGIFLPTLPELSRT